MIRSLLTSFLGFFALTAKWVDSHWVNLAQFDDSARGFRSITKFEVDRNSLTDEGSSTVRILIRMTFNQNSTIGLGTIVALETAVFDCSAGRFFTVCAPGFPHYLAWVFIIPHRHELRMA